MSKPYCQPDVCARRAPLLIGLTLLAGCALNSPVPETPVPPPNEAPIDIITSVPTPTQAPIPTTVAAVPIVSAPEPLRDVLDRDVVRDELTTMFGLERGAHMPSSLYHSILQFVDIYSGRARDSFALWLAREGRWGPMIREELRSAGMPEDLVYLSLVESGFSNTAVSRARAVGMWQFMTGTARSVGLRVDDWVDERRDPELATTAAIRHLQWLHGETGDWALTAAAYNAGLGRVNRVQKDAGEEDYFRLVAAGRLPKETRNYVPAIMAASLIANNRARFGFSDVVPDAPFQFESIDVGPLTRLSAIARAARSSERELRELNPQLLKHATPPGGSYRVRIPHYADPVSTSDLLAAMPAGERMLPRERWTTTRYTVRRGDGWGTIAQRHHTSIAELKKLNPRVSMLRPGMKLKVRVLQRMRVETTVVAQPSASSRSREARTPLGSAAETTSSDDDSNASSASATSSPAATRSSVTSSSSRSSTATSSPSSSRKPSAAAATTRKKTHTVRAGETMSEIAERYGISLNSLVRWNGMTRARPVRVGERLRLTAPAPTRHKVRAGESLTSLARRYAVELRDLMKWNGMKRARGLKVGETLIVSRP